MMYAGVSSFLGLTLENDHVPTFWLLLRCRPSLVGHQHRLDGVALWQAIGDLARGRCRLEGMRRWGYNMYGHMCVYTHACLCLLQIKTCKGIYVCVITYLCLHTYTCIYTCSSIHEQVYNCAHMRRYIYVYIYMDIYTHMHTYTGFCCISLLPLYIYACVYGSSEVPSSASCIANPCRCVLYSLFSNHQGQTFPKFPRRTK